MATTMEMVSMGGGQLSLKELVTLVDQMLNQAHYGSNSAKYLTLCRLKSKVLGCYPPPANESELKDQLSLLALVDDNCDEILVQMAAKSPPRQQLDVVLIEGLPHLCFEAPFKPPKCKL